MNQRNERVSSCPPSMTARVHPSLVTRAGSGLGEQAARIRVSLLPCRVLHSTPLPDTSPTTILSRSSGRRTEIAEVAADFARLGRNGRQTCSLETRGIRRGKKLCWMRSARLEILPRAAGVLGAPRERRVTDGGWRLGPANAGQGAPSRPAENAAMPLLPM